MKMRSHFLLKLVLQILQKVRWRQSQQGRQAGLTLIEILVSAIIAVIMITILLGFMVQLLNTNRREQVLTETQQEMKTALDYIANDVQSALYVYDGECLDGDDDPDTDDGDIDDGCAHTGIFSNGTSDDGGYIDDLSNTPSNSVPILAFWKLTPLPDTLSNDCTSEDGSVPKLICSSGKTPTLIIYFLSNNKSDTWDGAARIVRYELKRYNSDGKSVKGYVNPLEDTSFRRWPEDDSDNSLIDTSSGKLPNSVILTDFVDDRDGVVGGANCSTGQITPSQATLQFYGYGTENDKTDDDVRSFYACVSSGTVGDSSTQKRVTLFLRGNSYGKEGVEDKSDGSLPALSTEVLSRGVTNKIPR